MLPTFGSMNQQALSVSKSPVIETELFVYPNPATDQLNIHIQGQIPPVMAVYNAFGHLVIKEEFTSNLDVSQLVSGLYVLQVGGSSIMFQVQ